MPSFSWIKLYMEIIHDPKMGRLSDHLWRRAVELMLLAGETGADGRLPNLTDMAWTLRCDEPALQADLNTLFQVDFVHEEDGVWVVTNFAKRQGPSPVKERVEAWRERQRKNQPAPDPQPAPAEPAPRNEDVTQRNTSGNACNAPDSESDSESESDSDTEAEEKQKQIKTSEQAAATFCTDRMAEDLFQKVTGMPTFPASTRQQDIDRIRALYNCHGQNTKQALTTYFKAWTGPGRGPEGKGYFRGNTGWLDWAVAGQIPPIRQPSNGNGNSNSHGHGNGQSSVDDELQELRNGKR